MHACINLCEYMIQKRMRTCLHMHTHTHKADAQDTYTHRHTFSHAQTHTQTHTHTHIRASRIRARTDARVTYLCIYHIYHIHVCVYDMHHVIYIYIHIYLFTGHLRIFIKVTQNITEWTQSLCHTYPDLRIWACKCIYTYIHAYRNTHKDTHE